MEGSPGWGRGGGVEWGQFQLEEMGTVTETMVVTPQNSMNVLNTTDLNCACGGTVKMVSLTVCIQLRRNHRKRKRRRVSPAEQWWAVPGSPISCSHCTQRGGAGGRGALGGLGRAWVPCRPPHRPAKRSEGTVCGESPLWVQVRRGAHPGQPLPSHTSEDSQPSRPARRTATCR